MKSAHSLKGKIKHLANRNDLNAYEIMQMYFFERILERIEKSIYKHNLVIKGGFLIASMIGVENRTTMDIDTTVRGVPVSEETIRAMVEEIIQIDVGDNVFFQIDSISYIREDDDYENFRVQLIAHYEKIRNPLRIDLTTGDEITPRAIEWKYDCIFEDKQISIMVYPIETILAEKYESIIKRNIATTRMRDFYDLHTLYKLYKEKINYEVLESAIERTSSRRDSLDLVKESKDILEDIRVDAHLKELWKAYVNENRYVGDLLFEDVVANVVSLGRRIGLIKKTEAIEAME